MDKDTIRGIGNRITNVRRANHVTQEALSEMLDVTPKHVSHVENATSCFSLKTLVQFCDIFNCSLDYIVFGGTRNDPSSKLPEGIISILHTGSKSELDRLNRYLEMYLELRNAEHE